MKSKIFQEVLAWCENKENNPDVDVSEFFEFVFDKTADALIEQVREELKQEFEKGNLTHPFIISSDYYLDLKLKEIREKCSKINEKAQTTEKISE